MSESLSNEVHIKTEGDIVLARRAVREFAVQMGFGVTDIVRIVTAASELARNIFKYATEGNLFIRPLEREGGMGLELKFVDQGPGIADIGKAMREGYSSSGGYGMGLPGAKKLMDEMEIYSSPETGTTVVIKKWREI